MQRVVVKKIGLWILTLTLFAAHLFFRSQAQAETMDGWKEIYARSGDCRISFPAMPQMIQKNLKTDTSGMELSYDVYLAPYRDHAICLLLVAQYPAPLPQGHEKAGLEGLLKGIVGQNPDNRLVFAEMKELRGFPALNFLVHSGKNVFRGHAVMADNKLFMIAMEGTKQHFDESIFQRFLKSFFFLP